MERLGLDSRLFGVGVLNLAIVVVWLVLVVLSLSRLCHASMSASSRVLWAALILGVPVLGAVAVLLIMPGAEPTITSTKRR